MGRERNLQQSYKNNTGHSLSGYFFDPPFDPPIDIKTPVFWRICPQKFDLVVFVQNRKKP